MRITKKKLLYTTLFVVLLLLGYLIMYAALNKPKLEEPIDNSIMNKYERDYVLDYIPFYFDDYDSKRNMDLPVAIENPKYDKINFQEAYYSLVAFYEKSTQEYYDYRHTVIQLATNKYISVSACFYPNEKVLHHGYPFKTCVTIDLESGQEVFLSDLIDVNDEFIHLVRTKHIVKTTGTPDLVNLHGNSVLFTSTLVEELKQIFDECSRPMAKEDSFTYYLKPSFYLAPNRIYFANFDVTGNVFYISLDDIEEFLKVEKW